MVNTGAGRERDILLAWNEFAYVQDLTKGDVSLYVGPTKVSLSNTERMVKTESVSGKVREVREEEGGIQNFVQADSSQYIVLKNPAIKGAKNYSRGPNTPVDLQVGKKVVKKGPVYAALWPGQSADVIDGHTLEEDEYLILRAYDTPASIAKTESKAAKPTPTLGEDGADTAPPTPKTKRKSEAEKLEDKLGKKIEIGTEFIVRGSETSFYIPPNGFEVVQGPDSGYVRKAVKLMDGEYCVLLTPNGEQKYVQGPMMVIPEPDEKLKKTNGQHIYKAHTMKPEKGLHLYVTKDFKVEEGDPLEKTIGKGSFKVGQELFVKDKDGLFFPNENIEMKREIDPISLAENEGIYVRDMKSGEIKTVKGSKNFLTDPTKQEVITRTLDEEVSDLYKTTNDDYKKAVSIYVPPNTAVMVTSEKGRKVVEGPKHYIMDYSEDLETLALSTGTPKNDKHLLETVYLQVEGNKVSDVVDVETKDHANLAVKLSYRISFEEEKEKWFDVRNYVGLLCDHLSSLVRSSVKRLPLDTFYSGKEGKEVDTDMIRDTILGPKEEGKDRKGRFFKENNMRVYDLEVLKVEVMDDEIAEMLDEAQKDAFQNEMDKRKAEMDYDLSKATNEMNKKRAQMEYDLSTTTEKIKQDTYGIRMTTLEKEAEMLGKKEAVGTAQISLDNKLDEMNKVGRAENEVAASKISYEFQKEKQDDNRESKMELLEKETEAYIKRMEAVSPNLVATLERLGDQELVMNAAQYFGDLSILEGKSLKETMEHVFKALPFLNKDLSFLENMKHEIKKVSKDD